MISISPKYSVSEVNGSSDGLLVKFDSFGYRVWDQVYGGSDSDIFSFVMQTTDGGYVVVGQTELLDIGRGEIRDIHNGVYDGLLAKFATNGERLWNSPLEVQNLIFLDVTQTDDGGYAAVGNVGSSNSGEIVDINHDGRDSILVNSLTFHLCE